MQGQDQSSQSTPESSRRLGGKVAAITGTGQGIGRETVLRLAREGASIFASDIREDLLEQLESEVKATGATIATGIFDAAKAADAPPFVQAVIERYGRIDIMVNNAGGIRTQPFPNVTEETWDWTINLNLKGPYFYMQEAAKPMMVRKKAARLSTLPQWLESLGG